MSSPSTKSRRVLARHLAAAILLFSGSVTLVTIGTQLLMDYRSETASLQQRLAAIRTTNLPSMAESVWHVDRRTMQLQLDGIVRIPDVLGVRLLPTYGEPMESGVYDEGADLIRVWPLTHDDSGERVGELRVSATLANIQARTQRRALQILLTQTLKTIIVTLFILAVFHWMVTRHLEAMARWSIALRLDGLDERLELHDRAKRGNDELGIVVNALNAMRENLAREIAELNRARTRARRFVPRAFLSLLGHDQVAEVDRGDTTSVEVVMLFADIRGFTPLAERHNAPEVFAFINRHLQRIEPAILDAGGFINEYRGDGFLALFHDIPSALAAAEAVARVGSTDDEVFGTVDVRVGVHRAEVMLGVIGGQRQLSAAVVGDGVNLTSRIEGLTRQYSVSVLASESCVDRVTASAQGLRCVDQVQVVGRVEPLYLWQVGTSWPREDIDSFHQALERAASRDFEGAVAMLEAIAEKYPDDSPTRLHLERYRPFCDSPPPSSWTSVHRWTEK